MGYVTSGRPVGRPRQFYKYELPSGVVKVVRAQCADFARKELCIQDGSVSEETLNAYIATNAAIKQALFDIEETVRQHFLNDIAENRGYDKSQSQWCLSHNAYYKRKRKAIYEIAKGLLLI